MSRPKIISETDSITDIVATGGSSAITADGSSSPLLAETPTDPIANIDSALPKPLRKPRAASTLPYSRGEISPEVCELVDELRDTTRRIDHRKLTPTSLRRALSPVREILDEITYLGGK